MFKRVLLLSVAVATISYGLWSVSKIVYCGMDIKPTILVPTFDIDLGKEKICLKEFNQNKEETGMTDFEIENLCWDFSKKEKLIPIINKKYKEQYKTCNQGEEE